METRAITFTHEEYTFILAMVKFFRDELRDQADRERVERFRLRLAEQWQKAAAYVRKPATGQIGEMRLYTVDDLAEALGIHRSTIRGYIRKGAIKGKRIGWRYYVTEEALKEFLARR